MSRSDQAKWQQRWITVFREEEARSVNQRHKAHAQLAEDVPEFVDELRRDAQVYTRYLRGDRYRPCLLRMDHDTTVDDITAQLLAYLLQEEMVYWEKITPLVQQHDQRTIDAGSRYQRQMIHRGQRTPEETPDWDALDAQLAHHSRRAKARNPLRT